MRQLLSSLSYFSIFFAPFLLPLIVWIIAQDNYVRGHAKKAFFSHVFPFLALIPLLIFMFNANHTTSIIGYVILFFIIYIAVFIYNIFQGIKVFRDDV